MTPPTGIRNRGIDLLIFLILFVSFAWFYQAGGWNQNSRLALTKAIVEQGTLRIDSYESSTGDKAKVGEHFYSDKAPALSFLAVPGYWTGKLLSRLVGAASGSHRYMVLTSYFAEHLSVAILVSLMGIWAWRLLLDLGARPLQSFIAVLICCLGTILFPYATLLHSHAAAAALLVGCLYYAHLAVQRDRDRSGPVIGACLLSGLLAGLTVPTEFPAAVISGIIFVYLVISLTRRTTALIFVAAALPPVIFLAIYNTVCFGGPFAMGYSHEQQAMFKDTMNTGFFGIHLPTSAGLWGLTFGSLRGLFVHSPIVLVGLAGIIWMIVCRRTRWVGILFAAASLYLLLLISSYSFWHGGAAFGPRHLVAIVPFLTLPIAFLLGRNRWLSEGILVIAACSFVFALAAAAVNPEPPDEIRPGRSAPPTPLSIVLPAFLKGHLSIVTQSYDDILPFSSEAYNRFHYTDRYPESREWNAFNLGELLGLKGLASLAPLLVFWIVATGVGVILLRRLESDRSLVK